MSYCPSSTRYFQLSPRGGETQNYCSAILGLPCHSPVLQHVNVLIPPQASSEKVQALMRVSQAEQTAEQAFEETGKMLDQVADLKDKVQKVSSSANSD